MQSWNKNKTKQSWNKNSENWKKEKKHTRLNKKLNETYKLKECTTMWYKVWYNMTKWCILLYKKCIPWNMHHNVVKSMVFKFRGILLYEKFGNMKYVPQCGIFNEKTMLRQK